VRFATFDKVTIHKTGESKTASELRLSKPALIEKAPKGLRSRRRQPGLKRLDPCARRA
jgi:hypothetical protein